MVIFGTTFVLASTIFDFEFCTPTFKNIKQLTSSEASLKVAASAPKDERVPNAVTTLFLQE